MDVDIIDEVIYCKSSIDHEKMLELIEICEEIGVTFRLQSEMSPMSLTNAHLTHFEDVPFLTFMNTPKNTIALAWKSFTEFWISFLILFILSPVMIFIAFLIKVSFRRTGCFQTGTCRITRPEILYL